MANSPQAIKRVRQAQARRLRQRGQRSRVRTLVKQVVANLDGDTAKDVDFAKLQSVLDTAARKGVITVNRARRLKSRLNQRLRAAGS